MAVHCKIKNANPCYLFNKSGFLVPAYKETIKKHTTTTEKYVQVGDPTKEKNLESDKGFKATHEFDKVQKATLSRNLLPTSATKSASSTAECISHRGKYHAEVAMFSLEPILNVPHINLDGGLMACWSDVKEILFPGCSGLGCKIVLRSLEMKLKYPLLTKDIRSCSATERSRFINSFHCVRQGETIVNLRLVKRHWEGLVEMVAEKHYISTDATSANCCCKSANTGDGDKSLDILCDVECSVGSHYYHNTDCSVEVLSVQRGDKIVHPVPGFVMRDQCGQKEMYVPLVTLLSTYQDLSSWLRAFLGQLAEKCVRIPGSQRWLNKPLIVFCSERQGQIISHLMSEHGCSGPHITSRTMLVKWSYLTKSYFAGKILTQCLEQNDNYNENCSTSSLPKSNNSCSVGQESSEPKDKESTLPLRPIQNYQEQLWHYQKLKHQFCKQVTYRVVSRDRFQALGPQPKSGAEVINKPTESGTLTLRKKWLSSLGKYGDEEVIPLRRTGLECWANSDQSKSPLTERRKMKVYRHDSEKENDATRLATSNPRIHHSGQENANFKDLTSEKRYRRYKEKVSSLRPCYKDRDRPHDTMERSGPRSQGIQNVHSNNSRSRDVADGGSRRASSENVKKADCDKTFESGARKIGNKGSSRQRRTSHPKEEQDGRERNSDSTPRRTSGEQATKGEANSPKGGALFSGKEEGNSLDAEQETRIGALGTRGDRVLNEEVKNGDRVDNHGSRRSSRADGEGVKLIQQLKPSGETNNKRMNKNNYKNKGDDENKELSVVLVNSYATIATHNNNNNNNNYNTNNNADEYPTSSNNGITNTKDNSTSKTLPIKSSSTNSQKSKNMNKNSENIHVNELKDGVGCDDKNKAKNKYKVNMFETVSKVKPCLVCQSRNSDFLSSTETASGLERDEIAQEKRDTLRISHGPKGITTQEKRDTLRISHGPEDITTQEKRDTLRISHGPEDITTQEKRNILRKSHGPKDITTQEKRDTLRISHGPKDITTQEKRDTLRISHGPKDITTQEKRDTLRISHGPKDITRQEKRGALRISHGPKDITTQEKRDTIRISHGPKDITTQEKRGALRISHGPKDITMQEKRDTLRISHGPKDITTQEKRDTLRISHGPKDITTQEKRDTLRISHGPKDITTQEKRDTLRITHGPKDITTQEKRDTLRISHGPKDITTQEKRDTLRISHGPKGITTLEKRDTLRISHSPKDITTQEKRDTLRISHSPKDITTQEKRDTLRISHSPKNITTVHERAAGDQTNKNQEDAVQERYNLKADPKSDQLGVGGNSESEDDDEDIVMVRSLTTQHGCKENPHLSENSACKSAQSETVKLRPLKKNILMRESTRKDLECLEENRKLGCKCQDLYTPFEPCSPQKHFKKKFKVYCSNCPVHSTPPEQVKQDRDSNRAYASINDTDIDSSASHHKSMSPLPLMGAATPSPPLLTYVENRTSPRHPKKTLLDIFRKEAKGVLKVDQISIRDQALQAAGPQEETIVLLEEARQESPSTEIPNERLDYELQIRETNSQNMAPLTASSSQLAIDEPVEAQSLDHGVWDNNGRLENDVSSRLSLFYDQRNPTIDSCSQQYSVHHESDSECPFAFRLECIYDSESQRVGYIHRQFPAISVPYIMIGSVEFITVRSALKLFSEFDENCFVKCFLRDDKQAMCQTTCSQDQKLETSESANVEKMDNIAHHSFSCPLFNHAVGRGTLL